MVIKLVAHLGSRGLLEHYFLLSFACFSPFLSLSLSLSQHAPRQNKDSPLRLLPRADPAREPLGLGPRRLLAPQDDPLPPVLRPVRPAPGRPSSGSTASRRSARSTARGGPGPGPGPGPCSRTRTGSGSCSTSAACPGTGTGRPRRTLCSRTKRRGGRGRCLWRCGLRKV